MRTKTAMATIPVTDAERARSFYEDTLGFERAGTRPAGQIYRIAESLLLVYKTEAQSGEATVASIDVEDLDAAMKELRDKGVSFMDFETPQFKTKDGVVTFGDGMRGAWFRDPDGNVLAIGEGQLP